MIGSEIRGARSIVAVAAVFYCEIHNLRIPVFTRILVPLSIFYNLRKFDAFRSVVMALDIWQLPSLAPSLRGITRKRDTGE